MDDQALPVYPYVVIKDHGGTVIRSNPVLIAAVLEIKARNERIKLNTEVEVKLVA